MHDSTRERGGDPPAMADSATIRTLVESYLDGACLITEGKVRYANVGLGKLVGLSTDRLQDRPVTDFLTPNGRERIDSLLAGLERSGAQEKLELELVCDSGSLLPVEVSARSIEYNGQHSVLGVIRDISSRKRAEARLERQRENEELFRVLYEDNPSMYFTVDRRGVVQSVNKFGAEQLGYRPEELIGRDVIEVFYEKDKVAVRKQLADCLADPGRIASWEFRKVRKDGRMIWVRERARTVLGADGHPIVLIVCEDVTEFKQAEEERRRLEVRVRHAQKLEGLGVMAGGIGHDFNNLLVGILGHASLALSKLPADSPVRRNIQSLEKTADQAAHLCKQLLAYSGRSRFEVRPLDLTDLVADLRDLISVAVSKTVVVSYELSERLPAIEGDAAQIRQVVMNLVTNASEAIGEQAGRITIRTDVVEIGEDLEDPMVGDVPRGRYVSLEVLDSGAGMDGETRSKIFDPFFTTKFTGRGLGLAAVLGIVRGHHGSIQVETKISRGTTFRTLFPASVHAALPVVEANPLVELPPSSGTILVIDDESIVRSVAEEALQEAGFTVLTAVDGQEGVARFRKNASEIDAVLLDQTMPGLNGEECVRLLREIRPDVRIVLSSGYDEIESRDRFVGEALIGFIQKPYRANELVSALRAALAD